MPTQRNIAFLVLASIALPATLHAGTALPLHEGWQLQSACNLQAAGDTIATPGFQPDGWLHVTVPTTVLAAQTAAGVVPNPYFGDNLRKLAGTDYPIGDNFSQLPMRPDSPYSCGWWYRTAFQAPAATRKEEHFWLHFGGINYRADIWLNGKKLADSADVAGTYRTYDFDVTALLQPGKQNVLAVETFAPTEKDLGLTWVDWSPCPPDKDMGLWGEVHLSSTGPVTLRSPIAVTHLIDDTLKAADLTLYAELHNATDHPIAGQVSAFAGGIHLEQVVELAPHEEKTVTFNPERYPKLHLHAPQLWWPRQMGEPHLERLTMSFTAADEVSDEASTDFGIREITSELTANGSRLFRVNGKPILIRGGGWSQDMMLRADDQRLRDQFRMVQDMNLNTIRLEGKLDTDEFFHLADRQGILVMLGWCCCDYWEQWKTWNAHDLSIATASLRSQMLRLRSHASLLVWLNGSDHAPPPDIEKTYLDIESETHWPNPILSAATAKETPGGGANGVKMTGPYDYVDPNYWSVDQQHGGAFGFNTETSPGPAIPSLASREKFLPDPKAWPPTSNWSFHDGSGHFATLSVFDEAMVASYAKPSSAEQYERIAQTMEYDTERAMFEAYSKNKYTATGVIQWMLNNAWPSMIWHLYDYYLDAGASYFATKKACEPLHIQYAYDDSSIVVVNSTYKAVSGLHASVHIHNLAWKEVYSAESAVSAGVDSVQRVFTVPEALYVGPDRLFFIDLRLTDASGTEVSRNFYWVPGTLTSFNWPKTDFTHTPALRHADLTALTQLPPTNVTAIATLKNTARGRELTIDLDNRSSRLAFQLSAAVRTASGGLIAPVFWSDNWIELVPGESRKLTALLPETAPAAPIVQLSGWNIQPQTIVPVASVAAH